ncbi:MAG: CDP-alcohol phosphatidyltransferase family protein [Myxococcales bacterium]|nr:CDP-alcohol phosphatidyltransferase family protein [Myxococcales bacterium]
MRGLKAPVRDEVLDAAICRPLGRWIARRLGPRGITANQVTLFTAALGVITGVFYAAPLPWPVLGGCLFFFAMVFDCVDGELARRYGGGDWRGRIFDGLADGVTAFSVLIGMVVHLGRSGISVFGYTPKTFEWLVIFLPAGASFMWHSAVVDNLKQRLKRGSIDNTLGSFASEPKNAFDRVSYALLVSYVRWMQRSTGSSCPGGYLCFRRVQWVGPTHHHFLMMIAALCIGAWPRAYLGYWVFAVVIANLYMVATLWISRNTWRKASTSLT